MICAVVRCLGDGYHTNWIDAEKTFLCEMNSDHWKSWVHQRLSTPVGNAGGLTLFHAAPQEHLALAKHLTAEIKTEEFIAGKGVVTKWERRRKQNHWLDALYNACAVGHYCGVRLVDEVRPEAKPRAPKKQIVRVRRPDGSPWIDTERWREMQKRYWGR
jgi:hypothetical protein